MAENYCRYKGLLLKLNDELSVKKIISCLGGVEISNQAMNNYHLLIFNKKSRLIPPKPLEEELKKTKKNGWYTYKIYFLSFEIESQHFLFILSPLSKLLKIFDLKLKKEFSLIYVACNLKDLFNNDFYAKSNEELIFVKRVNAQVLGEGNKSVINVSMFGHDVLNSKTLKKILSDNSLNENESENNLIKFIPNSVRLTYEDGTEFSLNMDKSGNYSFYLKKQNDFDKLLHIIVFLFDNNFLLKNIYISPLTRNEQAIKIIEI